jgi:signal transduction histidine kinase
MQREFISIASHELRNPIQPILNYADLAKKGLIPTDEALDVVMEEAGRLSFLANNILDVSRIESGQLVYRMEKFFINGDIFSAIESTRSALKPGVSIDADLAPCEKIEGDRGRISQVIANVLLNAVRYTDKGRILVQSRVIGQSAAASGGPADGPPMLAIKISDTGRGIPEDILPKVFDKFVTTSSREGSKEGTGLGLYISRAIVEAHGGRMVAYNNPQGGGATFEILLPFSQAARKGTQ